MAGKIYYTTRILAGKFNVHFKNVLPAQYTANRPSEKEDTHTCRMSHYTRENWTPDVSVPSGNIQSYTQSGTFL